MKLQDYIKLRTKKLTGLKRPEKKTMETKQDGAASEGTAQRLVRQLGVARAFDLADSSADKRWHLVRNINQDRLGRSRLVLNQRWNHAHNIAGSLANDPNHLEQHNQKGEE